MDITTLPKHHALLITASNRIEAAERIYNELKQQSPAHTFFNQTVLDIETARKIISWANTPYNEEKFAVISFHTAGLEAQNTLLKILEEPRNGIRFILVTSNKENLIATVLSRVVCVEENDNKESLYEATKFLETSHALRMKLPYVVDILSRTDEEDRKDRESVREFILALASVLNENSVSLNYVEETLQSASYAADPSASGKALLEYLSLLLPQTKA